MEPVELNNYQGLNDTAEKITIEYLSKITNSSKIKKISHEWSKEDENITKKIMEEEKIIKQKELQKAKEKSSLIDKETFSRRTRERLEAVIKDSENCEGFRSSSNHAKHILNNLDKFIELYRGKAIGMAGDKIVVSNLDAWDALHAARKLVPETQCFGFEFW